MLHIHPSFLGQCAALAAALTLFVPAAAGSQAAPSAPGAPPGGRGQGTPQVRGGYTEAATLPVRIVEFTASAPSIKAGESVTLSWAVENPRGGQGSDPVTLTPAIGRIPPRSTLKVAPAATTTYTLTANGINGPVTRTVTVTVAGTQPVVASSTAGGTMAVPRTADGKPDLSGVYGYGAGAGRGGPPPAPGAVPTTPTLTDEKYRVVRGPDDTGLYSTCRPPGVPQTFFVPYYTQIIQAPKHVVILHEYLTLPRVILMDEELPVDPDPFYMGHSVGRWEGDTLVVESRGFKESEITGYRTTEALRLVERFRRPTYGTLEYEVTVEDPNVFKGPWRIVRTFPYLPEYKRVDEFFCENNRDYKPLFGK
jgi:hypothetical protein